MLHCGWESSLGVFVSTDRAVVMQRLKDFVDDASESQVHAWVDEIKILQTAGQAWTAICCLSLVFNSPFSV